MSLSLRRAALPLAVLSLCLVQPSVTEAAADPRLDGWGVLSKLAGKSYADKSNTIIRFRERSPDTYLIYAGEFGDGRPGAFDLRRTSPDTAVMLDDHSNRVIASIRLLPDGWIETRPPRAAGGFGQVSTYKLIGDVLWENIDTVRNGQVVHSAVAKYRRL